MSGSDLAEKLCALAPGARLLQHSGCDWHSATFSGKQIVMELLWAASASAVQRFSREIAEWEFEIPGKLVADIAVSDVTLVQEGYRISVEALILDEDI